MTQQIDHLDDYLLSAVVDDELTPDERARVQTHLGLCSVCQERLEEFRSVAALLRRLPEVEPPRDFSLGPRLVVDPPNVIRLRRWYTVSRAAAASLAAAFVFLSVGTLYVDSRPPSAAVEFAKPQAAAATALAGQPQQSAPATSGAAAAVRAAAPAAAPAATSQTPPAAGAAAPRPAAPNLQADDQTAAATSVRALPTLPPTTVPTAVAPAVPPSVSGTPVDQGAPWRNAAIVVGVLAVLTLVSTLVVHHRLQQAATHH